MLVSRASIIVFIDDHGQEVHEPYNPALGRQSNATALALYGNAKMRSLSDRSTIGKRLLDSSDYGFDKGILYSWCGCGYTLNHGDTDAVVRDLKNQVGNGVDISWLIAYYSIRGRVVAFACNDVFGQHDYSVSAGVDAEYLVLSYGATNRLCGWYMAGTSFVGFWAPIDDNRPSVGYMRYSPDLDFCGNALTSPAERC
ncbi:hypothetical protein PT974_03809 [Cladobotryum mycophilum]|uniref:Uncharacterized protein n=1 Tax=Cladobotryum mycophilum TaxID=491253 RepID=A0ABR0SUI5_9HYPO